MTKVLVVGSLNADLVLSVDRLPGPGETVLTRGPAQLGFGGKGGNQACAAARLGADAAIVARVGDDDLATAVVADLVTRGVGTSHVRATAGSRTGSAVVVVDSHGENLIVVDAGANATLGPADIDEAVVSEAAVVLVQLEIPLPAVREALSRSPGLVVLNPAPAQPLDEELLARVDVLVPNRRELALLVGATPPEDVQEALSIVHQLPGHCDVVVTLGAGGALVVDRHNGGAAVLDAPAVDVLDATGAGDTFCGALAVALSEGRPLQEAARLAVGAASLSTTAKGARGLLPTRPQAEAAAASVRPVGVLFNSQVTGRS